MFVLSGQQVDTFRQDHLEKFFERTALFLKAHVEGIENAIPDLPAFIRSSYRLAKKAGHSTEREIVHFILDEVEKTSPAHV